MTPISRFTSSGRALRNWAGGWFESLFDLADYPRKSSRRGEPLRGSRHLGGNFEQLEDRVVPANNNWIQAAGGFWNDPNNWSLGHVPTAADRAIIGAGFPTVTIGSLATGYDVIIQSPVAMVGGTLSAVHQISVEGTGGSLTLSGGTIQSGDLMGVSGTFSYQGGTIAGTPNI